VRFSPFALMIGTALCLALPGWADVCDATPGNVVVNCAFADGTYTSSIPYLPPPNSDPGIPNSWFADPGFIEGYLVSGLDTVVTNPISGTDYLSLGPDPFEPEASLSQFLTDVSGVTYDIFGVSDSNSQFYVQINGAIVSPDSAGTLSFVGTGDDELTLLALEGQYDISDVIVAPAVPEPRAAFLLPFAMLAYFVWLSRHRRPALP
jgi:hypothetical protein